MKRFLYLFQLENYDVPRFLRLVAGLGFKAPQNQRGKLVWTPKAWAIFGLAVGLAIVFAAAVAWLAPGKLSGGVIFGFLAATSYRFWGFVFLAAAAIILWPLDFALKRRLVAAARQKLRQSPNLKIIGITGSYGKTTMKEALAAVLGEKLKVLKTPENMNTPLGLARTITKKLNGETEVLIAEMGAYRRGDIAALCGIARPALAVLTGINEAHLERFGSLANTVAAKFEIVENANPNALAVLNADSELVAQNHKKHLGFRRAVLYSASRAEISGAPKVPVLGQYILGVINACVIIARQLGMTDEEIRRGIARIRPIPHRLQLLGESNGVTVIDDSYNGNPEGVSEAIEVLAGFPAARKVYITPGLVEMGGRSGEIHEAIGRQLAAGAGLVILIKNSVTPAIARGLTDAGFSPEKIMWFESAQAAHSALPQILKAGDVILFQNDWPDNYL